MDSFVLKKAHSLNTTVLSVLTYQLFAVSTPIVLLLQRLQLQCLIYRPSAILNGINYYMSVSGLRCVVCRTDSHRKSLNDGLREDQLGNSFYC